MDQNTLDLKQCTLTPPLDQAMRSKLQLNHGKDLENPANCGWTEIRNHASIETTMDRGLLTRVVLSYFYVLITTSSFFYYFDPFLIQNFDINTATSKSVYVGPLTSIIIQKEIDPS